MPISLQIWWNLIDSPAKNLISESYEIKSPELYGKNQKN